MARSLLPLRLPAGPEVLRALPELAEMLAGRGPARCPVPEDDTESFRLETAFAFGSDLTEAEDGPDDPTVVVVGTSGSTGTPKGALLSAAALHASAAATRERVLPAGAGPAGWLLALPPHHIAGLQVLLRAVTEGTEPVVLDSRNGFTAAGFTAVAARMPAGPSITSLVPTQLHRILADPEATAALAGFDAVLVGGAATSPALQAAAQAVGVQLVTTYGMSETCGGCVYDGRPLTGVTALTDAATAAADPGTPGERVGPIVLTGPVVARGYRGLPGHPAFRIVEGRRGFVTGDLGRTDPDGVLHVLGRADDVIVTGGVKIAPGPVEAALAAVPGVTEAVVVGVPDPEWGQLVGAVVVTADGLPVPDGLLRDAAGGVHPAAVPRRILTLAALPLRGPGKPDRTAVAALLADADRPAT